MRRAHHARDQPPGRPRAQSQQRSHGEGRRDDSRNVDLRPRPALCTAWRYGFLALARKSVAHRDAARIAESVDSWNRHMRLLDDHFQDGGQFITGEFFTLADVVIGLSTHRWLLTPLERPALDA